MDMDFPMGEIGPDEDDDNSTAIAVPNFPAPRESEDNKEVELTMSLPNRKISSFMDIYDSEDKMEFLIPDVLPESGLMFVGGLSGTGKTILAKQLTVDLVLGRPTMTWKPTEGLRQIRVLMFSLEMSKPELQRRQFDMYPDLTDAQRKLLDENYFVYAEPEPFDLWDPAHCIDMVRLIKNTKCDVVLIDSASVSFGDSLKDDTQVNKSLKNLFAIRSRMDVAIIVVAHTRKPPAGIASNPEEASINELFGHSGIAQHASSIYLMIEDEKSRKQAIKDGNGDKVDKKVHLISVKSRFGSSNAAFPIKLTSRQDTLAGKALQFRRDVHEIAPVITAEQRQKIKAKKSPLSASFENIDFTAMMEGDDI